MKPRASRLGLSTVMVCCLVSAACGTAPAEATQTVTQRAFLQKVEAGEVSLILDVRTPEEFDAGHVAGAVNVPHDRLGEHRATVDPHRDDTIVVYCRSGRRAGIVEDALRRDGFRKILHLEGDMLAWEAADLPLERRSP